jgi:DNA replication and repair protein RecF
MPAVELIDLSVRDFRNLSGQEFRFGSAANTILGPNGAGKTSLLEAMVVLGNLRSFRTTSLRRAVRHNENSFRIAGTVSTGGRTHRLEQVVEVGSPVTRTLRVDGVAADVERYLQLFPVFAITAQDRELVVGSPDGRRSLLDRFVFLLKPTHFDHLRTYRRLLRQRNAALVAQASDAEIEVWEEPLAAAAAAVIEARESGTMILGERFLEVSRELSPEDQIEVSIEYRSEAWSRPSEGAKKVEDLYRERYNETRTRDRQMGFTGDGPHRHDLSLKIGGRGVRYVLSSGQTKRVAAALRLATLAQVERERNERFPVIVDDVDAELDGAALALLVERLGSDRQLFLSSTSERVAELAGPRGCCIRLENGTHVPQEAITDD